MEKQKLDITDRERKIKKCCIGIFLLLFNLAQPFILYYFWNWCVQNVFEMGTGESSVYEICDGNLRLSLFLSFPLWIITNVILWIVYHKHKLLKHNDSI